MTTKIYTRFISLNADTLTPVSIYLKIRDKFNNPVLLESSDYHASQNSTSFVCFQPLASISLQNNNLVVQNSKGEHSTKTLLNKNSLLTELNSFKNSFDLVSPQPEGISQGLFGYTSYDAVHYFEDIDFDTNHYSSAEIPDIIYSLYQYVIVINHFHNEMFLIVNHFEEDEIAPGLQQLVDLLNNKSYPSYTFHLKGKESSNMSDSRFLEMVASGKKHCQLGNVFQLVLSRSFSQAFSGDEFNVYRALRKINPSPYLFYFDFGNFKLFGSSPEAQLVVKNNIAEIHPIAGTVKRTGNDEEDLLSTEKLKIDKKENAEHIMLVDLARNDLSRHCQSVQVDKLKEIHFYSHVIHLVSKVSGQLKKNLPAYQMMAASFPAGTLSGAPKHKAMQLIHQYERDKRGYYGGCIGFMGFNNNFNHAIMIRTFLSKNNCLYYRAGAGVVVHSNEHNELMEVNNKIGALRQAIQKAGTNQL